MSARRRLATFVHVADDNGKMHVFGPSDQVPGWAIAKIVNPKAWEGGDAPDAEDPAVELARLKARLAELEAAPAGTGGGPKPPPMGGPGSGKDDWAAYAAQHDVTVPDGSSRDQVVQLLDEAGVPTK